MCLKFGHDQILRCFYSSHGSTIFGKYSSFSFCFCFLFLFLFLRQIINLRYRILRFPCQFSYDNYFLSSFIFSLEIKLLVYNMLLLLVVLFSFSVKSNPPTHLINLYLVCSLDYFIPIATLFLFLLVVCFRSMLTNLNTVK